MQIGSVRINNFTVLAPLAGVTNLPFRLLAKSAGCGLVYSEMVSANGLVHGSSKTIELLNSTNDEKPLSVQIFGSEPDMVADAAQIVQSLGADIVDINFGCSVRKILKTGSGSALMKNQKNAKLLLKKVRNAIDIPLTIKMRSGWESSGDQAVNIARIAQECGVNAIAIHPRTATQGFKGTANWSIIKAVKKTVSIPIIGNGDIQTSYDAIRMKKETGCDYIMVGRAAIGNPLLFKQILSLCQDGTCYQPSNKERIDIMEEYLEQSVCYLGEKTACYMMRSHLCWFLKGMKGSAKFQKSIRTISSKNEAIALISEYKKHLTEVDRKE